MIRRSLDSLGRSLYVRLVTQGGEQSPYGQDSGDFGEREKLETGNPVFRARAIHHEKTAEPEERLSGGIRGFEGYTPFRDSRRCCVAVIADGHKFLFFF